AHARGHCRRGAAAGRRRPGRRGPGAALADRQPAPRPPGRGPGVAPGPARTRRRPGTQGTTVAFAACGVATERAMRVHHKQPTLVSMWMLDVFCCALGCVTLLFLLNSREAGDQAKRAGSALERLSHTESELKAR